MERVIVKDLHDHFGKHKILSDCQHGFTLGKSTLTNLLESVSDWTLAIDNKQTQTVAYIDFSKAFDSVSHPKLLHKLNYYGISGKLLSLISNFLSNRTQVTQVGNEISHTGYITSGVIQGSCLGPFLFLLFINDLPQTFHPFVTTKIYADDAKLYAFIHTLVDEFRFQNNLNRLVQWAIDSQLSISFVKCLLLQISNMTNNLNSPPYFIGNELIPTLNSVRDLGVTIDSKLNFKTHINKIVKQAYIRSGLIFKCFLSKDVTSLTKAFTVYVRPLLEYCTPVWSPHTLADIHTLENVQRRFTKKIPGMFNLSYLDRLESLGLETLEIRRLRFDLITAYKIYFGAIKTRYNFLTPAAQKITRGHDHKLTLPKIRTDTCKYFFSYRIAKIWNTLNADFNSLNSFKSSLTSDLLRPYLKFVP